MTSVAIRVARADTCWLEPALIRSWERQVRVFDWRVGVSERQVFALNA